MRNPIFAKLLDTLTEGGVFNYTNTGNAEVFVQQLDDSDTEVSVAISGDLQLNDAGRVEKCLRSFLAFFERKSNVCLITGTNDGVERMVRDYARKYNFRLTLCRYRKYQDWETVKHELIEDRNQRMVNMAQVVLVITNGKNKASKALLDLAVSEGRFVARRVIKEGV